MKDSSKAMVIDPFQEARRYVENAKETLKERGKLNVEMGRYEDPKYVKAAGHYLWLSVLMALDAVFHVEEEKVAKKGLGARVTVGDYMSAVSKRDGKLRDWVVDSYRIAHLSMGYDGVQDKAVCAVGIRVANAVIDRCEALG